MSFHFVTPSSTFGNFRIIVLNDFTEVPSDSLRCIASTTLASSLVFISTSLLGRLTLSNQLTNLHFSNGASGSQQESLQNYELLHKHRVKPNCLTYRQFEKNVNINFHSQSLCKCVYAFHYLQHPPKRSTNFDFAHVN